jgi:hypothetical protein
VVMHTNVCECWFCYKMVTWQKTSVLPAKDTLLCEICLEMFVFKFLVSGKNLIDRLCIRVI